MEAASGSQYDRDGGGVIYRVQIVLWDRETKRGTLINYIVT